MNGLTPRGYCIELEWNGEIREEYLNRGKE